MCGPSLAKQFNPPPTRNDRRRVLCREIKNTPADNALVFRPLQIRDCVGRPRQKCVSTVFSYLLFIITRII